MANSDTGGIGPAKRLVPVVDISGETERQVIVAEGTADRYEGHPTTLLADDGKTMFCVWTAGHGGPCGQMARSDDGGLTWTRLDALLPEAYRTTHRNCPTLQKIKGPDGKTRYFIFSNKYAPDDPHAMSAERPNGLGLGIICSEDGGANWRECANQPQLQAFMPPTGFMQLKDGSCALFGQVRKGTVKTDRPADDQSVWMATSRDGGFTWSDMRVVATAENRNLCEPCCLRSPDGATLVLLMRENRHQGRSMMCFSNDEGKTWTTPRDTSAALTGDRHEAVMLPDGRYVVAFRNQTIDDPLRGQYMAWVGTWDDMISGGERGYRIHLLRHFGIPDHWPGNWMDTGYSGVERLPDGTVVCTTYSRHFDDDRQSSVVSTRFKITETDLRGLRL